MRRLVRTLLPAIPLLFAISPILFLFQHNQTDISPSVTWIPLAVSAATGAAFFAISWIVFKQISKAALLASLLVVAIFYYGFIYDIVSAWGLTGAVVFGLWVALFVGVIVALLRVNDPSKFGEAVLVTAAALVLISFVQIGLN